MTDTALPMPATRNQVLDANRVRKRYAAERRFRWYGIAAIVFGLVFLGWLLSSLVVAGAGAFQQTRIKLDVRLDAETADPSGKRDPESIAKGDFTGLIRDALRR